MNKNILTVCCVLLFVPLAAIAQTEKKKNAEKPSTKLEAFLLRQGTLIIIEEHFLGEMNGRHNTLINVAVIVAHEPGQENQRTKGLRIEVKEVSGYSIDTDMSYFDKDEAENLSNAVGYIIDIAAEWEGVEKEHTEVFFSDINHFRIGFWHEGTKQTAYAASGIVGAARFYFKSSKDLSALKSMIDEGLKLLSE